MEILQETLVFVTFFLALGYMVTRFIWKPTILKSRKGKKACGISGCGCD